MYEACGWRVLVVPLSLWLQFPRSLSSLSVIHCDDHWFKFLVSVCELHIYPRGYCFLRHTHLSASSPYRRQQYIFPIHRKNLLKDIYLRACSWTRFVSSFFVCTSHTLLPRTFSSLLSLLDY